MLAPSLGRRAHAEAESLWGSLLQVQDGTISPLSTPRALSQLPKAQLTQGAPGALQGWGRSELAGQGNHAQQGHIRFPSC